MNELIHISYAKVYQFKHITFEWHSYCGPFFLRRKDLEPKDERKGRPMRDYGVLNQWLRLDKEDRENYRVIY